MSEHNIDTANEVLKRMNDLIELWNMPSGAGRRVLLSIIATSKAMDNPYNNSGQQIAFNVGKASVGKEIINDMIFAGIDLDVRECMGITIQDVKKKTQEVLSTIKNGGKQNVRSRNRKP